MVNDDRVNRLVAPNKFHNVLTIQEKYRRIYTIIELCEFLH